VQQSQLLPLQPLAVVRTSVLGGCWLLNGHSCINPFFQLYAGDVLTLSVSGVRLSSLWYLQAPLKQGLLPGWLSPQALLYAPHTRKLPYSTDNPEFLEVDELSLSVCLLLEPA
jgi:hypothetical protein